jgi:hypothetical protein
MLYISHFKMLHKVTLLKNGVLIINELWGEKEKNSMRV